MNPRGHLPPLQHTLSQAHHRSYRTRQWPSWTTVRCSARRPTRSASNDSRAFSTSLLQVSFPTESLPRTRRWTPHRIWDGDYSRSYEFFFSFAPITLTRLLDSKRFCASGLFGASLMRFFHPAERFVSSWTCFQFAERILWVWQLIVLLLVEYECLWWINNRFWNYGTIQQQLLDSTCAFIRFCKLN